jgi:hypothetical protein
MKKLFIFFVLIILAFQIVSSVSIESKDIYKKGENFIAKISGNFVNPLTKENIHFYRGHTETFFGSFNLTKIGSDYYVSFQIPLEKPEENYSISLENIKYKISGQVIEEPVNKSFQLSSEVVPFLVSPIVFSANENYSLNIESLANENIIVKIDKEGEKSDFDLNVGEEKNIIFNLGFGEKLVTINFEYNGEIYSIYVYEYGSLEQVIPPEENITQEENFSEENQTVNESSEEKGFFDFLFRDNSNTNDSIDENDSFDKILTCDEIQGIVCNQSSTCDGELKDAKDGKCCIGKCVIKEETSVGKIIGWSLIVAIALFLTWFFKVKYKGTNKSPVNLFKGLFKK